MSTLATTADTVKLDLACGQRCAEGFEGVDLAPCAGVKHVVNLWKFPWPFEDSSVDEIHCSHHVEHIPMVWWGKVGHSHHGERVYGHKVVPDDAEDRDLLFRFFDECYRILKPGGRMTVFVPNARSDRAFQDPTHRRYLVPNTFLYLNAKQRVEWGIDHYAGGCDFDVTVEGITAIEEEVRCDEVKAQRFKHMWNVVADWKATLVARKGQRELPEPMVGGAPFLIERADEAPK